MHNQDSTRAIEILAKATFKQLQAGGYERVQMIRFATELLALIGSSVTANPQERIAPTDLGDGVT
ncbi:hypothetical protein [Pendulispora albinea]|uniref:Uncharacterized protein n=1 Tax=Pendulispora albinea TaxID=2741071 RepID=A0ABZ2MB26_9BACT